MEVLKVVNPSCKADRLNNTPGTRLIVLRPIMSGVVVAKLENLKAFPEL